jgi:hypothetical protein
MPVIISEVIRRAEQGVTLPFLCRSANGALYFVKGSGVGKEQLRAEWMAGCLARSLALPIPDFDQVEVPHVIVKHSSVAGIADLGTETAFGSALVESAEEIGYVQSQLVDLTLQAKILVFDWWIQNGDRTLTALGGNPNVLCTGHRDPRISIIDHHAAFDRELDASALWDSHIFREGRSLWSSAFVAEMAVRLEAATALLSGFWSQMPESWFPNDDQRSDVSQLEFARLHKILTRPFASPETFWNGVL